MGREADFSQLEEFIESWQIAHDDFDNFLRSFLLEMAQEAIADIKENTPVDTGALRNTWAIGDITGDGISLSIEVINSAQYASFVEFGHRQWQSGNWVEGRFMMTVGIDEIKRQMPARFDAALRQFLADRGAV